MTGVEGPVEQNRSRGRLQLDQLGDHGGVDRLAQGGEPEEPTRRGRRLGYSTASSASSGTERMFVA